MPLDSELQATLSAYKVSALGEEVPSGETPSSTNSGKHQGYDPSRGFQWTDEQKTLIRATVTSAITSAEDQKLLLDALLRAKEMAPRADISGPGFRTCFHSVMNRRGIGPEFADVYFEIFLEAIGHRVTKLSPTASRNSTLKDRQNKPTRSGAEQQRGGSVSSPRTSLTPWDPFIEKAAVDSVLNMTRTPQAIINALKWAMDWVLDHGAPSQDVASRSRTFRSSVLACLKHNPTWQETNTKAYRLWKPAFEAEVARVVRTAAANNDKPKPSGIAWEPTLVQQAFEALNRVREDAISDWDALKSSVYRARGMGAKTPRSSADSRRFTASVKESLERRQLQPDQVQELLGAWANEFARPDVSTGLGPRPSNTAHGSALAPPKHLQATKQLRARLTDPATGAPQSVPGQETRFTPQRKQSGSSVTHSAHPKKSGLVGGRTAKATASNGLPALTPAERNQHIQNIRMLNRPASFTAGLTSLKLVFSRMREAGNQFAGRFAQTCDNKFLLIVRADGYKLAKARSPRSASGVNDGIVCLPATSGFMIYDDERPRLLAWRTQNNHTETLSIRIRDLTGFLATNRLPEIRRTVTSGFTDKESSFDVSFLAGVGKVIAANKKDFGCVFVSGKGTVLTEWQVHHLRRMAAVQRRGHKVREFERKDWRTGKRTTVSAHTRGGTLDGKKSGSKLTPRAQTITGKKYFRA